MYMLSELLPSDLLSGRHPFIHCSTTKIPFFAEKNTDIGLQILDNGTTDPQRSSQTKTTMPAKDSVGHTYMTAGYHLQLWLFFEG